MSIDRCIAALRGLDDELRWMSTREDIEPAQPRSAGNARLGEFMRDLALDVDLRSGAAARASMSEVESELYFPAIKRVLSLATAATQVVRPAPTPKALVEALGVVDAALKKALLRQGAGLA
jgi:hypothetical protein